MHRSGSKDSLIVFSLKITYHYARQLAIAGLIYALLHHFWSRDVQLTFHQLTNRGLVRSGLVKVWFIFAWAIAATIWMSRFKNRGSKVRLRFGSVIRVIWTSLNAGFFEELLFRWILFFGLMIVLTLFNTVTHGVVQQVYKSALLPAANWATFHALQPQLLGNSGWVFGAAMITAAFGFREANRFLAILGQISPWFLGMVMFYLVFNYGLLTAMVAHVIYDLLVLTPSVIGGYFE